MRDAALAFAAIAPTKPDHHYTRLYGGLGPPEPHLRGVTAAPARLDGVRLGIFRAHAHDADQVRAHLNPNPNPDPDPNPILTLTLTLTPTPTTRTRLGLILTLTLTLTLS